MNSVPWKSRLALLVLCGIGLGCGLSLTRPLPGLGVAALSALAVGAVACLLFWYGRFWFSWLLIAGAQVPCAWVCVALWHTQRLYRENANLEGRLRGAKIVVAPLATPAAGIPSTPTTPLGMSSVTGTVGVGGRLSPVVSQYTLLRRIGKGAYGEVYLARNAIGGYHAVKVVYREDFAQADPYDREFRGIQKYMPVSLNHPGLVHLLHVGRNDEAGYFYYVMELGDGKSAGAEVDPERYAPRNLFDELQQRGRLSVATAVELREARGREAASPSPRPLRPRAGAASRTGRGLGRGEFNGVWTALLSPALSSLRGRRGRSCRVSLSNIPNSTAVGPG